MSLVNLLPEDYVQRGSQRRANVMCLILFGITMAALGAAMLVNDRSSRQTRDIRDRVEASYAKAAAQIKEMQQLEARRQDMLVKAEAISSLLERVPRSHLLGIVTRALPENTSLVRVDIDTKKVVPLPAVKEVAAKVAANKFDAVSAARAAKLPAIPTVVVDVVGLASTDTDVAKLMAGIATSPVIASVDLVYSQEKLIDKLPVREFQIHLEIKQNADSIIAAAPPELARAPDEQASGKTGPTAGVQQ